MGRKRKVPSLPSWFDLARYAEAESMDAGDWLLNLTFRRWLNEKSEPEDEALLREFGPVLRRADERQEWELFGPWRQARDRIPGDVWTALRTGRVKRGIEPLSVFGMYAFEQKLPSEVRAFGSEFVPGRGSTRDAPPAFNGRLDHAFEKQMLGRFVRVDLSLPDDVLIADLQAFVTSERVALAKLGGPQPYREAAGLKGKPQGVRILFNVGLLPFLDLDRWQRSEGLELGFAGVRGLFTDDRSRDKELRHRVSLAQSQMKLHAWFARLERSAKAVPKKRASPG